MLQKKNTQQILQEGFDHIWLPYTQMKNTPMPPLVDTTKGNYIILNDGTKLIDGVSSWWSACHGYNHPHIIKKTAKQLKKMPHIMLAGLANEPAYRLSKRLVEFTNINPSSPLLNRAFLSDSGSTAVEVALKMAVQYFINQDNNQKHKIIAFNNSYHGDTMGGMSLCDPESGMHAKFKNYLPNQLTTKLPITRTDLKNFEDFVKLHHQTSAAIIIEPLVQCAGGMKFHSKTILEKISSIAKKYDILLIFDECATGFYRTGKKFAFHHTNITPDILIIGKALTGGIMTLAATLTTDKIYNQFLDDSLEKAFMHGPTFMGNSLACTAANASLDLFDKINYTKKVNIIAQTFQKGLKTFNQHPLIKEVRVMGAIAVLELKNEDWDFIFNLRKQLLLKNTWLRPFSNVIYFMPPLTIKKSEIKKLINAVKTSLPS